MITPYKLIPLGEAKPGMVLSDDFLDRHRNVLLPKGTVLTEKLLASLQRYEMDRIPVIPDETESPDSSAIKEKHRERLEALFRKHDYGAPDENANALLLQHVRHFRIGEGA